jgi:pyridoxamine 5'-phosphate oxidase
MEIVETPPSLRICEDPSRVPLDGSHMDANPFVVFGEWFDEACAAGVPEVNAMSLATAGADGRVTCRTVLLKAWDEQGFVFFTNYESEKAAQLTENPQAALLFPWLSLGRQIEITGKAEKITPAESARYFLRRPFKSRVGAWVSAQSRTITSRQLLEAKFEQMLRKFRNGEVPLPDTWGGYRVAPQTMEFWQAAPHRLHDRIFYKRAHNGSWRQLRLQP